MFNQEIYSLRCMGSLACDDESPLEGESDSDAEEIWREMAGDGG